MYISFGKTLFSISNFSYDFLRQTYFFFSKNLEKKIIFLYFLQQPLYNVNLTVVKYKNYGLLNTP